MPDEQLDLLEDTRIDRAMSELLNVLGSTGSGDDTVATEWSERADEPGVQAMIRVASSLATSRGTTRFRWQPIAGNEQLVELTADHARALASALAGKIGREIISVVGHLRMAQDDPPRVGVRAHDGDEEYVADINTPELLDIVKEVLFGQVRATIAIDMRTSPTSGRPTTRRELMDLEPA